MQRTEMKAVLLCRSMPNGRHERNGSVVVMFMKKLKHEFEEKFCDIASSGCGNGVGRAGAEAGIVGSDCAVSVGLEDVVGVADPEPEGKAIVLALEEVAGSGFGWRLWKGCECGCARGMRLTGGRVESIDALFGQTKYRAAAVTRMITSGTRSTAHRVRRPAALFAGDGTGSALK